MKNKQDSANLSRRKTPWDDFSVRNPEENLIRNEVRRHYDQRHQRLEGSPEIEYLNSLTPKACPHCGSVRFVRFGRDEKQIQRYRCKDCKHTFNILTGTIFDSHKIPITEWIEYWRNLFQFVSLNAGSWNNKNAFNTSKYWFKKTCMILSSYQDDIVLQETVWYDETYKTHVAKDVQLKENGQKYRGHSKNQICIGSAVDCYGKAVILRLCDGAPNGSVIYEKFQSHIKRGSTLITDEDSGHRKLVRKLDLKNKEYNAKICKALPDNENPLTPINDLHSQLKKFLRSHDGFKRSELDDYLNLFVFMYNSPNDKLEKIKILINRVLEYPKTLRYRTYFRKK